MLKFWKDIGYTKITHVSLNTYLKDEKKIMTKFKHPLILLWRYCRAKSRLPSLLPITDTITLSFANYNDFLKLHLHRNICLIQFYQLHFGKHHFLYLYDVRYVLLFICYYLYLHHYIFQLICYNLYISFISLIFYFISCLLYGCLRESMRGDDYKHLMTIGSLRIRKANNLYISFIFLIM